MSGGTVAWEVTTDGPRKLEHKQIGKEHDLETWILKDPTLIEPGLAILARQLMADGKPLDLLALSADGSLVVIELKRDEAYREALAQAIDYAAWLDEQTFESLRDAVDSSREKQSLPGKLDDVLREHLDEGAEEWDPAEVEKRIVVAGTGADDRLRRMIAFLSKRSVAVNGVFFDVYAGPSDSTVLVRSSILSDAQTTQTRRRGRGGSSERLDALAKENGTEEFVAAVLDGWKKLSGRSARPEGEYWTLSAKAHGGRSVIRLHPKGEEANTAWAQLRLDGLKKDLVSDAKIVEAFEAAGFELDETDPWVGLDSAEKVTKFLEVLEGLYSPGPSNPAPAATAAPHEPPQG